MSTDVAPDPVVEEARRRGLLADSSGEDPVVAEAKRRGLVASEPPAAVAPKMFFADAKSDIEGTPTAPPGSAFHPTNVQPPSDPLGRIVDRMATSSQEAAKHAAEARGRIGQPYPAGQEADFVNDVFSQAGPVVAPIVEGVSAVGDELFGKPVQQGGKGPGAYASSVLHMPQDVPAETTRQLEPLIGRSNAEAAVNVGMAAVPVLAHGLLPDAVEPGAMHGELGTVKPTIRVKGALGREVPAADPIVAEAMKRGLVDESAPVEPQRSPPPSRTDTAPAAAPESNLVSAVRPEPEASTATPETAPPTPTPTGEQPVGRPASPESGAIGPFGKTPPSSRVGMSPQTSAAFDSIRERILPEKPKMPFKERAVALGNSIRDFYRQESPIADFEKATAGKVSDRGPAAYAQYAQGSSGRISQTGWEEGVIESKPVASVKAALDAVPKEQHRDLSAYLVARQELSGYERLPSTTAQGPPRIESGFDPAAVREVVKAGDAKPEWVAVRNALREQFGRSLDDMLDAGAISRATYDRIKAADPKGDYYGPWERVLPTPTTDSVVEGGLKPGERKMFARSGGTQPILDPLPRVFDALRRRRALINDARVGQKLLEWHDQNPQGAEPFMREITNPNGSTPGLGGGRIGPSGVPRLDFDAFVQKWEAEHPGERANIKLDHGLDAALSKWAEEYAKKADEGVLAVHKDGATRFFELPDKRFARTVFGLDADSALAASKLYQAATWLPKRLSRVQRIGITGINPDFIASQVTKDPRSFLFNTQIPWQKNPQAFVRATVGLVENYVKSMYGGVARTRLGEKIGMSEPTDVVAYRQAGAEGYYDATRPKGPVEGAVSKAVEATLGNAEGAMSTLESAPRQLEYTEALKRFGHKPGAQNVPLDDLVAASNVAAKVTDSFKLGSKASKEIAKLYPYFSARMQGVATVLESMKRDPKTAAIRIAAISVVPRLALWLKNKDDPAYRDAPTWRKYGGWNIVPGKVWLPGVSIIDTPGVAMEAFLNKMYAQDPHAATGLAQQLVEDYSPIGDPTEPVNYVPGAAKGPIENKIGKDTFTGAPINPKGMEGVERIAPDLVARETTSKAAQAVSKRLHEWFGSTMTAAEIDHLLISETGGTGKRLLRTDTTGPKESSDTMILGRFVPRIKESQAIRDYYENRGLAQGANRAAKLAAEAKDYDRAAQLGVGRGSMGPEAKLSRIDKALADASDRYNNAEEKDRPKIAQEMVDAAKSGLEILRAVKLIN